MTTTIDLDRLKIETRAYLALLRDLLPTLEVLVEQEEAGGKETSAPASAPGPWRSWHGLHSMVADAVSSDPLRSRGRPSRSSGRSASSRGEIVPPALVD